MPASLSQYSEYAEQMRQLYEQTELELTGLISSRAAAGLSVSGWQANRLAQIQDMRRDIDKVIRDLSHNRGDLAKTAVNGAYAKAAGQCLSDIRNVARAAASAGSQVYHPNVAKSVQILQELNTSVSAMDRHILRQSLDAYADVIGRAASMHASGSLNLREAVNIAVRDFASRGITGFVDKAGRHWDMSTYAEMATLTAVERATRYGYVETMQEYGYDLAIISAHAGACPLCEDWENVVISVSGNNPNYPSMGDAEAGGCFHPRCLHDISTYYGDLDSRRKVARDEPGHHTAPSDAYSTRCKQRSLERRIREQKRIMKAAQAAGDPATERAAYARVRQYQSDLRDLRSSYNARTSHAYDRLPRKYDREGGRVILSPAARRISPSAIK